MSTAPATTVTVPIMNTSFQMASLYVGDLHPDVTEAMLFDKFSAAGPVVSIRVCRDMITKRSLGYAYVNFQQPADAERALDTMNYDSIRDRPIRIMWSQRDPGLRKSGVGNVFIKNLDKNIDTKSLYDTFSAFGNILSCKIMCDEKGESKGFGFVHFETTDAASVAIGKVHDMLLAGKKVFVGPFIARQNRTDAGQQKKFSNVFIKNFEDKLDTAKLTELMEQFGKITSCIVAVDKDGTSRGFGFCNFETPDEAEEAVRKLHEYEIDGKKLFVGPFRTKAAREFERKRALEQRRKDRVAQSKGVNLYIKNLDDNIDDDRLKNEFGKFGNITSAVIMKDNGRSKGFGFVCFTAPDDATKALTEMNGAIIGSKPLYVALAQRKDERRAQLANHYRQRAGQHNSYPQMPLPYPNGMIPYMAPIGAAHARGFYGYNNVPNVRPYPRWPQQGSANNYRPPIGSQMMNNMQLYQAAGSVSPRFPSTHGSSPRTMNTQHPRTLSNNMIRNQMNAPQQTAAFTNTARNLPQTNQNPTSGTITLAGHEPLTAAALANATPQQQKQMLGERLYALIYQMNQPFAGKITGMLLEIDNTELLHMLESRDSLRAKVEEAMAVLDAHMKKGQSP